MTVNLLCSPRWQKAKNIICISQLYEPFHSFLLCYFSVLNRKASKERLCFYLSIQTMSLSIKDWSTCAFFISLFYIFVILTKVKADIRNLHYITLFKFSFLHLSLSQFQKLKLEFIGFLLAEKCHICPVYLNQNHLAWIMFLMQRCTTLTWFYDRIAWPNMRVDMAELQ